MQAATQITLSNLVEEHITTLIREAAAVNRHSKRGGIVSAAIAEDEGLAWHASVSAANGAEKRGMTRTGDGGGRPQQRRRIIHHDDVNMALFWRGSEKLYVSSVPPCVTPPSDDDDGQQKSGKNSIQEQKRTKGDEGTKSNPNTLSQLLTHATEHHKSFDGSRSPITVPALIQSSMVPRIDLNSYLQSEYSMRPPCELGLTLHWLAVDGTTPMIPMNEVWNDMSRRGRIMDRASNHENDITPLVDMAKNADEYYEEDDNLTAASFNNANSDSSIRIRELQRRLLSEELQLYYVRVTNAIESSNNIAELSAILHGIRTDGGIQELVPFLSRFVGMGLTAKKNLLRTEMCRKLVKVFDAMLDNSNLHLDLHLHQMFTPVGTCVVAKKLSNSPYDDHWSLREEAARCLIKACDIYGEQYTTMKPRVIKILTQQALRIDRPPPTQYGGIVGISLFGPRAVDAFLLPLARAYWERWEMELMAVAKFGEGGGNALREYELSMCQQALLNSIGIFMQNVNAQEQAKRVDFDSFAEVFGERLIPLNPEQTNYMMAIL